MKCTYSRLTTSCRGHQPQHDEVGQQEGPDRHRDLPERDPADAGADEQADPHRRGGEADHEVQHREGGEVDRVNAHPGRHREQRREEDDQRRDRLHEHADDQQDEVDHQQDGPALVRERGQWLRSHSSRQHVPKTCQRVHFYVFGSI